MKTDRSVFIRVICGYVLVRYQAKVSIQARKGTVMNLSKQANLVLVILLCAVIGVMASNSRGNSATAAVANQDPSSLDRRISLLEQRFYTIESNISRLQQYMATQR